MRRGFFSLLLLLSMASVSSATLIDLSSVAPTAPIPGSPGTGLGGLIVTSLDSGTFTSAIPSYIANTGALGVGNTIGDFLGTQLSNEDIGPVSSNSDVSTLTPATVGTEAAVNFNMTLTGYLAVPAAGDYFMYQASDDEGSVKIAGNLIDSTVYRNPQQNTVRFSAPGLYPILVNLHQGGGGTYYQLGFKADGSNATQSTVATGLLYTSAVPEPASLVLFALGAIGMVFGRRRLSW